ncbi:hypothetical protein HDV01_006651 [Terramyces sp. JEL0728]|nr:hypothetical protein HDV01_006651 [Terramyces sp. JEL0728]
MFKQETVLYTYIWESILVNEWYTALGENATVLTRIPRNSLAINKLSEENSCPKYPELSRRLYKKFLRALPFFSKMGPEYLAAFDSLMDKSYAASQGHLLIATKMDALAFLKFYTSLFYRLHLEEIMGIRNEISIWNRYLYYRYAATNSFSLDRPTHATQFDANRMNKYNRMVESLRIFLRCVPPCKEDMKKLSSADIKPWWALLRQYPKMKDLPAMHQELVRTAINAAAHVLNNILDEPARLEKMSAIYNKIPTSLLVTSLKIVNPAPFIRQCVKLFLWQPSPGVYSLFQRMASHLCGYDETSRQLKSIAGNLSETEILKINTLVEENVLSSLDDDTKFVTVAKNEDIPVPSDTLIEYFRLSIRLNEKKAFIEHLNTPAQHDLFVHLFQFLPKLLNEFRQSVALSEFVGNYFKLVDRILKALLKHSNVNTENKDAVDKQVIEDLILPLTEFAEFFYPVLVKMAKLVGTTKELQMITSLADFLIEYILQLEESKVKTTYHQDLKDKFNSLDEYSKEKILSELDLLVQCCEMGLDETKWPRCATIDQHLTSWCYERILTLSL